MCGTGKGISWTGLPEYHVPLGEGEGDGGNGIPFLLFLYSPPRPDTQATVRRVRSFTDILSVKKILAVINATYAVAKRKPEKIRLAGIRTLTSAIPLQRSNQLS